jgi:hypothetical protein
MRTCVAVWLTVIGLAAGLAGCQSPANRSGGGRVSVPTPEPAAAEAAGLSSQAVEAGRHLYGAKCARCHKFYDPAKYDSAHWERWMSKMSRKAKLQPEEEDLLGRYLGAFRLPMDARSPKTGAGR